jgi:hypothetical protein
METSQFAARLALDLASVCVLTFAIYWPRHRRRDLIPAYLALNTGLFTIVLGLATAGGHGALALGFGLFGVLSIIRLRSDAVQYQEVAYYFTTLVLGLIGGIPALSMEKIALLDVVLLLVVYGADHPRLCSRTRRTIVTLDTVHAHPDALRADLARRLGQPLHWTVTEVDYVRDVTVVDVRYRVPSSQATTEKSRRLDLTEVPWGAAR